MYVLLPAYLICQHNIIMYIMYVQCTYAYVLIYHSTAFAVDSIHEVNVYMCIRTFIYMHETIMSLHHTHTCYEYVSCIVSSYQTFLKIPQL